MAETKVLQVTEDQLASIIEKVVAAVRPPAPPPPLSEEEQFHALQRMASERPLPKEFPWGRIKSHTGATFTPRVVASRKFPKGRVVELQDYAHPDGTDRYQVPEDQPGQDTGGLVPIGKTIGTLQWKQWKYETFWKADLAYWIGRDAAMLPPGERASVAAE